MKTKTNYATVVVFVVLLAAFFWIGVLAPRDEEAAARENRTLKPMPQANVQTIFSGSFSTDFEDYLADNVGYRSLFMDLSAKIGSAKGIKGKSGTLVTANKDLGAGATSENELLVLNDRVMEIYKRDDAVLRSYVEMLNAYAEVLPQNVQMYSLLAPTQIEFNDSNHLSDSQKQAISYVYNNMNGRICGVPVYETIAQHTDEYIYFRTDHHWTQRGAFYAYQAFCGLNGKTVSLSDYTVHSKDGFLGYLYNQVNDPSLKRHADTLEWLDNGKNYDVTAYFADENGKEGSYQSKMYAIPAPGETVKYALFMGGDHPLAVIDTDNTNGKTLLVIKDSYANALLPLLTADYARVLVVDPRSYYGTITDLVAEYQVDDCLFVNYILTTTFPDFVAVMNQIR